MDVAADDAVSLVTPRHGRKRFLIFGDIFHGGLGLEFQIRRERPVAETKRAAKAVEI